MVVEGLREVAEELGCRGAEDDFGGRGVYVGGDDLVAGAVGGGGELADGVGGAELDVGVEEVGGYAGGVSGS